MTSWELQKKIHEAVKGKLSVGMTERDVVDVISGICPDWQGDLISGKRTAEIEGEATDKVIEKGDVLLLDLQVKSEGQWSDLTRVYFVGEISNEQKEAYLKVKEAIRVGEENLQPGVKGKDLWDIMRKTINSPYAFDHHGGHRIGEAEEIVVNPRFIPDSDEELKPGMIVTLEPAIYIPEKFGIRLENNYLITEAGFERLDNLSLDENEYICK